MNRRDNPIAIYTDGVKHICRLCASDIAYRRGSNLLNIIFHDGRDTHVTCYSLGLECHAYGQVGSRKVNRWDFDNTKHKILLSTTECNLCSLFNKKCTGYNTCQYNIQQYTQDFDKEMLKVRMEI